MIIDYIIDIAATILITAGLAFGLASLIVHWKSGGRDE